jgi:hypothetical protein
MNGEIAPSINHIDLPHWNSQEGWQAPWRIRS